MSQCDNFRSHAKKIHLFIFLIVSFFADFSFVPTQLKAITSLQHSRCMDRLFPLPPETFFFKIHSLPLRFTFSYTFLLFTFFLFVISSFFSLVILSVRRSFSTFSLLFLSMRIVFLWVYHEYLN